MSAGMKMKAEVNYTPREKPTDCCRNCEFYDYQRCQLVAGAISGDSKCDLFSAPELKKKTGAEAFVCSDPC